MTPEQHIRAEILTIVDHALIKGLLDADPMLKGRAEKAMADWDAYVNNLVKK